MLNPQITELPNGDLKMTWTPDLAAATQGYRIYRNGLAVSRTLDKRASSTTFSRDPDATPDEYGLALIVESGTVEKVTYPKPPPDPQPGDLPLPLFPLSNPVMLKDIPMDVDFRLPASTVGKDVIVDYEGHTKARQYVLQLDNAGGPPRNMRIVNVHTRCTKPYDVGGSGYRNGGLKVQTEAQKVDVLDVLDEKRGLPEATGCDGIGIASETYTEWQFQRILLEGNGNSETPSGQHVDCLQIQGPLKSIKVRLASCDLSGVWPQNHPGKGMQLAEEPWNEDPGNPFLADIDMVDFECLGGPGYVYGVAFLQEFADGPTLKLGDKIYWSVSDAVRNAVGDNFGVTVYPNWSAAMRGTVSGTRPNRVLSNFPAASGITGSVKERPSGSPRFVTRAMLGY